MLPQLWLSLHYELHSHFFFCLHIVQFPLFFKDKLHIILRYEKPKITLCKINQTWQQYKTDINNKIYTTV